MYIARPARAGDERSGSDKEGIFLAQEQLRELVEPLSYANGLPC